jgi:uncharacterized protein (TIGR02265 family)
MTAPRSVRGYAFAASLNYLTESVGKAKADEVLGTGTQELRRVLADPNPVERYPIALYSEINRLIAETIGGNDEEKRSEAIVACGKYAAHTASNTFLRLLMRVLTPDLFAKKLPSLFARDFNFGHLEVTVDSRRLVCNMTDVEGFDWGASLSLGFAKFTLETMGKQIESTRVSGPTNANPGPASQTFELYWKA